MTSSDTLSTPTLLKMLMRATVKQVGDWVFPKASSGGMTWLSVPRTNYNYKAEIGDGLSSSVITPVVQWFMRSFPEAPLVVRERVADTLEIVADHPLAKLIEHPNAFYPGTLLWMTTLSDWCWWGESYWRILHQRGGLPGELWWLAPWNIEPKWPSDGSAFISHYEYHLERGTSIRLELDEVIHFRHGLDPRNPRHGLPPLRAIVREIWSDDEASNWIGSLLRNMGIPGMILSPKGEHSMGPEDAERVKAYVDGRFSGDNRGKPMILGAQTQVDRLSWSPNEMDLSIVRNTAEERVSAALGIPAAVIGFHSGLETTKVGATMHEYVRLAWHSGIVPVQRLMADELQRVLLPQFEQDTERYLVSWNYDEVEALQESRDDLAKRYSLLVTSGLLKVSEGREALGYDSDPEDEIYLRPNNLTPIDPKDQMPEPEPLLTPGVISSTPNGNGNGQPNGNRAVQQRDFKQGGTLEDFIHGIISRHAQTMDKPPRALLRLAAKLWRQEQALQPTFHAMLLPVLKRYGEMAGMAAREILIQKAVPQDVINTAIIHERLPFLQVQAELAQVYERMYEIMTGLTLELMSEALQIEPVNPSRIQNQLRMLAQDRVGLLDLPGDARESILRSLDEARVQGLSEDDMIEMIKNKVPSGRWTSPDVRSQILVRTETRFASNVATAEYARAAGIDRVLILDARLGPSDAECEARNGWVVSPSESRMLAGIEHTNGTMMALALPATMTTAIV